MHQSVPPPDRHRPLLEAIDRLSGSIVDLAEDLYRHPELSEKEERSCRLLSDLLRGAGFRVETGLGGLPTAFRAEAGHGTTGVALLAEYDALPGIGHGCGHNLIGAAAFGAALALRQQLDDRDATVAVIGTPAEETIGGKAILADAGVFDRYQVAMMFHPSGENRVYTTSLAAVNWRIVFHGRASHAVVHPEKGINALDALVDLYRSAADCAAAVGDGARLPGVIREGGERPNLVPDRAVGEFSLRARHLDALEQLQERFLERARGIAGRTRCRLEAQPVGSVYREMRTNRVLADCFKQNLKDLGRTTQDAPRTRMGSLDMGNVSQRLPTIHPFLAMVPPEVASHTAEFARATVGPAGRAALLDASRALALTAADWIADAALRRRAREEFEK